jgi:hypothetical protein
MKGSIFQALTPSNRNSWRKGSTYTKLTDDQKRTVIAQKRQHGDLTEVAKEMGFSAQYVSQVVLGKDRSQRILNRVYNKVRGRRTVNS